MSGKKILLEKLLKMYWSHRGAWDGGLGWNVDRGCNGPWVHHEGTAHVEPRKKTLALLMVVSFRAALF